MFPFIAESIVPKLLSSYQNTTYSTELRQSNSIKSTICQITTKFRNIFFT